MLLEDRVAVVTGAGRGIGREITLRFAAEGAHVVLAGRSVDALESVADEVRAQGREALVVATDLRRPEDVAALAERTRAAFERADVLVNN